MRRTPLQITQRRLRRSKCLLAERDRELRHLQHAAATGRLAANALHSFNNSLTAILGQADLQLLSPKLDPGIRHHAVAIVIAAQRMADTIRQLSAVIKQSPANASASTMATANIQPVSP